MLTSIKQRIDREDEGFTLIELMVVVLIIAILLAIAIPTFLGARGQANARAAQSSLRNALTAEQTYYTNNQKFDDTSGSPGIASIEPNLTWLSTGAAGAYPAASPNSITVSLGFVTNASDSVLLQTSGKDGNCYTVFQSNGTVPASNYGTGYEITKGACTSSSAVGVTMANGSAMTYPTISKGSAGANETSGSDTGLWTSW
jgi:type IV pilus assembly protein PilA